MLICESSFRADLLFTSSQLSWPYLWLCSRLPVEISREFSVLENFDGMPHISEAVVPTHIKPITVRWPTMIPIFWYRGRRVWWLVWPTAGENEMPGKWENFGVLPGSLGPLACGIHEVEVGATGKVVALSTSGALGLSAFLQQRLNERCVGVEKGHVLGEFSSRKLW